jgi:nitric oxide dioxygenase
MPASLSPQTIALVKATVPALEVHGFAISRRMYDRLFQDKAIRDLFNQSHHGETGSQPKALARAVLAFAQNIDDLAVLGAAVERIAQKHVGLNILAEHYPSVAEALLGAVKDVLGDAATPEIIVAWGEAYWFLADVLMAREKLIYSEQVAAPGGWNGWREFVITQKVRECEDIMSFVLTPTDGGPVLRHRPGQYLTFWLNIPDHPPLKRNYSISSGPSGKCYRISVKREPQGIASNWLHDVAEKGMRFRVAAPVGEFVMPRHAERPLVLLSGGVGQTPLLSMVQAAAAQPLGPHVHFAHGAESGATHAFGAEVRALATASKGRIRVTTFYAEPRPEDRAGEHFDLPGLITPDWLAHHTPLAGADYYLCGPRPFLREFVASLLKLGVPTRQIHYEFFGPADELMAA